MTRTSLSSTAVLLMASLLCAGCHRASEPAQTTVVVDEARAPDPAAPPPEGPAGSISSEQDQTEDAVKPDACATEFAGAKGSDNAPTGSIAPLKKRVTDVTGVLTQECTADLDHRLKALEDDTGAQVVVLLVPDLGGEDIEGYANRVFHQSRLGRKGVDDGALIVASLNDRHARIEVGYGLEGVINDAVAGDILRDDLKDNFAAKRYNAGISAVVDDVSRRIRSGPVQVKPKEHRLFGVWFFLFMLALSIVLGGLAESLKLRWPLRLLLIPLAADAVVLVATLLKLTLGYRLLIAMVPISLVASLIGIPFVRSPRKSLQSLGTCILSSLIIAAVAASLSRSNGHGFHVPEGWGLASAAIGTMAGSIIFLLSQILPGSRTSRRGRDSDDSSRSYASPSSSSSSSDSGSSSSSSDSGFSGGGGDSGGGGASTSW